jgi:hypothetical protein
VRRVLALGALAAAACAAPLRRPEPLEPAAAADAARPAAELLAAAEAAFARRPDPAAVARAEELFLAAAEADPAGVDGLAGAVRVNAWTIEHVKDPAVRAHLVASSVDLAQHCRARAPAAAACDYALAIALGQQARDRPATAERGLPLMVDALDRAARADPSVDRGGPERLKAVLLLRAPGWPLGPGDPEGALAPARAAAARFPDFPPNQLALGEALAANGDRAGARAAWTRARDLARDLASRGDPDAAGWAAEAERFLR